MKVSTKVRYGTRLLVDIATHQQNVPVSLKDIARRQQVSLNYLKHIVGPLVAAGILRTERGNTGGVLLARPAADITLGVVVAALQGSTAPVGCVDDPSLCQRNTFCVTRDVWCEVKVAVDGVLAARTIADLARQQDACHMPELR